MVAATLTMGTLVLRIGVRLLNCRTRPHREGCGSGLRAQSADAICADLNGRIITNSVEVVGSAAGRLCLDGLALSGEMSICGSYSGGTIAVNGVGALTISGNVLRGWSIQQLRMRQHDRLLACQAKVKARALGSRWRAGVDLAVAAFLAPALRKEFHTPDAD